MTVKDAFQKLHDYAVKRRDDPDNSATTTQHWVGYLDALKALKPVVVGTEYDKGETKKMVTFIEADAAKYAQLAQETERNVMVHRESDGSLTCEIDGQEFHTDNAWQLSSRLNERGFYGYSLWLDSVFSEPGVMWTEEGE